MPDDLQREEELFLKALEEYKEKKSQEPKDKTTNTLPAVIAAALWDSHPHFFGFCFLVLVLILLLNFSNIHQNLINHHNQKNTKIHLTQMTLLLGTILTHD